MLVLTRKQQEVIRIGENVTITILRIKGQSVRVGIDAPSNIKVIRGELELLLGNDGDGQLKGDRSIGPAAEEEGDLAADSDASGARSGLSPAKTDGKAPRLAEAKNRLPKSSGPSAPKPKRSCVEDQKCPDDSTLAYMTRRRSRGFSSN